MNSHQENTEVDEDEMETCQQKIRANQEKVEAKMDTIIITVHGRMEATVKTGLEQIWATIRASQEQMCVPVNMISSQAEKISKWVEGILASVGQRTQSLWEELWSKIQKVMTPVEVTWQQFKMQLAEVKTPVWHRDSQNAVTCVHKVRSAMVPHLPRTKYSRME
jgi:membrane-associated HD superfamily phosphohydrolase